MCLRARMTMLCGGVALHAPGNFAQFVGQRRFLGNHQEFPRLKSERAWGEAACLKNGVQVFVRDGAIGVVTLAGEARVAKTFSIMALMGFVGSMA